MRKDFIQEVVASVVGKQSEEIATLLDTKKHVNEFLIAKSLGITINQVRNILYKLSDFGLVSSIRKKDRKKGWYTYFWKIEISKAFEFLESLLEKKISQISSQINSRETKQFYVCDRCKVEVNEEHALLMNFTCDECGEIFALKDNAKVLRELKKHLIKYSNELVMVKEEIAIEKEKMDKQRLKEVQKEDRAKAKERAKKSAARKRASKKEKKKQNSSKQVSNKKKLKRK